ncbi:hypothetical protein [Palaeococcus ferrophilus]|uniref:hypothetical protein n=1 Tax=Palaeococcus ferrophilus TaxID=83868 RepID=UPI00064EE557|nr:hypothetical protein [Palaeococcus ferrophilus]
MEIPEHVVNESFEVAGIIKDPYFKSVAYAKMAYELYGARNKRYKDAFTKAVEAAKEIDDPKALIRALITIARYIGKCGIPAYKRVFYRAYEMARALPSPLMNELLEEIVETLTDLGDYDEALYYTLQFTHRIKKNDNFLTLLDNYLRLGNMRKAHFIIEQIEEEPWRSIASVETIKVHLKREEYGSAIKILSGIKNPYWLSEGIKETAIYLKTQGAPRVTLERFIGVAKSMSEDIGDGILKNLMISFGIVGEIELALDIFHSLPQEDRTNALIELTARILDDPKTLEGLIDRLEGRYFREVSKFVMDRLIESPDPKYYGVVAVVGNKTREEPILTKVVTYYSKLGEFQNAIALAQLITDNYLRSLAFGSIAVNLLKQGDVDRALEVAMEVRHPKWNSWLMEELLIKILEQAKEKEIENDLERRAKEEKELWR